MVDLIQIDGDREDIFNCIDFYENLVVVGSKTVDELRKECIDGYLNDYKNSLLKSKNIEYMSHGVYLDKERDSEISKDTYDLGNSNDKVPFGDNKSYFIEDVTNEDVVYVKNGIYLEDYESQSINDYINDTVKGNAEDDIDFIAHGVFLEEMGISENKEDSSEKGYSIIKDNINDLDSSIDYALQSGTLFSDDYDEPLERVDFNKDYSEEDFMKERGIEVNDEDYEEFELVENKGIRIDIDEDSDTSDIEEDYIEDVGVSVKGNNSDTGVLREEGESHSIVNIYKDVRDFVKKNSGCSISEVKEYFSQKDIQKALMSVKIVEKKNRLYVV